MVSKAKLPVAKLATSTEDPTTEKAPITLSEVQSLAQQKLGKQVWDFYVSGADDQRSAQRNQSAYDQYVHFLPFERNMAKVTLDSSFALGCFEMSPASTHAPRFSACSTHSHLQ
jgi:hypothetical protein